MNKKTCKLAIGTAQFGMSYGIANRNGQVHGNEIAAILNFAWENGINTLDTAKAYGTSEEAIGSYLKGHSGGSWEIITKISDLKNSLSQQLKDSIQKLSVRPISLLAHSTELFLDKKFQLELQEAKEKKLLRKTGISLYNENQIDQILEIFKPDIIQLPMNILDSRIHRTGMLARLYNDGIEIHVRSAFLQGLFYLSEADLKDRFIDVVPHLNKLKLIASEAELTLAELSLIWLVSLEEVSKVIIGVDNADQLKSHLKTLKKKVGPNVFEEALLIHYENNNILNPTLWQSVS